MVELKDLLVVLEDLYFDLKNQEEQRKGMLEALRMERYCLAFKTITKAIDRDQIDYDSCTDEEMDKFYDLLEETFQQFERQYPDLYEELQEQRN